MTLEQIKRINLEKQEDIQIFIDWAINKNNFLNIGGPAVFANTWLDALFENDEQEVLKIWILTLFKFSRYFAIGSKEIKENLKSYKPYVEELKVIFKESKIKTLAFMRNTRKWHSIIFSNLNNYLKVSFYALHQTLIKKLHNNDLFLADFEDQLSKENKKIIIGVKSYKRFLEELIKINILFYFYMLSYGFVLTIQYIFMYFYFSFQYN